MKRHLAALLLLAPALAGCDMPQPFRHVEPNPLLRVGARGGVIVAPVPGAPQPDALAEALSAALVQADVAATTGTGNAASYLIDGSAARNGEAAVLTWRIWMPDGRPLASHSQRLPAAALEDEAGLRRVAMEAAPALAALITGRPAAKPQPALPKVAVRAVTGAPGDGNAALAAALRRALRGAGYAEAAEAQAERIVQGQVALRPDASGGDAITIEWRVVDATGRELGRVAQGNQVPRGSLDGAWGDIARLVAEAATPGIGEVLTRTRPGD